MISRSDGRKFHLLLADRPLPYPMEIGAGPAQTVSVCFWYSYGEEKAATNSAVVLFKSHAHPKEKMYRHIEFIADALADELLRRRRLAALYNLQGNSIIELSY
jgi:hypothetical protein